MKQVININFQGRVVPIEVTAFDLLKNYTESLNRHFANEEGKEEIINDIESRIGELFQEKITKGATCITEDDVNAIINTMGRPEEFEAMDDTQSQSSFSSASQEQPTGNTTSSTGHKRLFRDENDKVLGGVCSGLANYFNIDVVIARIIFVVLLFSGIGFLTYIIMWIAVPSSATTQIGGTRKKLFRDPDEKLIAGVCSGIGNYFGINAWIPRVLFLLPFLSFISRWGHWGFGDFGDVVRFTFSPTSLIVYIILWIVIPEALTTSEKLEMKGEKVDMNSIKASVMEEMKGVGKKASAFGKEASAVITDKANIVANDTKNFARRRGGLGNVIAMIAKIFAYFVIGCVCLFIFGLLIALIVGAVHVYPLKDYLLDGNWENIFAWGTLFFFIIVPFIGILVWIIRKITNSKSNSKMLRLTFICLWIIGWVSAICFVASINNEFSHKSKTNDQEIVLSNPAADKMIVTTSTPYEMNSKRYKWDRFDSFEEFLEEDTLTIQNIQLGLVKSPDSSFHVRILKEARGFSKEAANMNASKIAYTARQIDSLLVLDKGIAINKYDKFRNQTVLITIYVPVGKQIRVNDNFSRRLYFNNVVDINDYDRDNDYYYDNRWKTGVDYIMNRDGRLYTLKGKPAGEEDEEERENGRTRVKINRNGIEVTTDDNDDDNYRYNNNEPANKIDSLKVKLETEKQKLKDSLEKTKQKIEKQLEKIGDNTEPAPLSSQLQAISPMMEI
jgi:phage shock protein PspC (stress-responsive transcriptional regulator)